MIERYSIEVNDDFVEIYGDLTIEEAFDFLNFYEKKGYSSVVIGHENSTLRMMRPDKKEELTDSSKTLLPTSSVQELYRARYEDLFMAYNELKGELEFLKAHQSIKNISQVFLLSQRDSDRPEDPVQNLAIALDEDDAWEWIRNDKKNRFYKPIEVLNYS